MAEADSVSGDNNSVRIQHRLETIIEDNRFTIAVAFPIIGAVTLVASAEGWLPPFLAYNAVLLLFGTLVMRSPLLVGWGPLIDRSAVILLSALVGYTYAIEYIGVTTDHPYGAFTYLIELGPMVGDIPLALPLFFIPLVANAYLLTILFAPRLTDAWYRRLPIAVAIVIAIDLVLDPAAVAIGFWSFDAGGMYYGVPVSNYLGWLLSGTIAILAVELAIDVQTLRERAADCAFILDDLVSFILLWGVINLLYLQAIPVLVTAGLIIALLRTRRYDHVIPSRLQSRLERVEPTR